MYKRAEEMYETWVRKAFPDIVIGWDDLDAEAMRGWYAVAASEAALLDQVQNRYSIEEDRLKAEMATMVKRKHYNDAIKSLSVCQQQIETMALELTRIQPHNRVAADAFVVLGLLEAIITANPDMQTEDWKADQKAKQDVRDAEYRASVWNSENHWEGRGDYITGAAWSGPREYVRQRREARGSTNGQPPSLVDAYNKMMKERKP